MQKCADLQPKDTALWAPSSEFVSSSIPSWQILTAHAQPFRGTRDLAFWLNVPLDSLLVWASSEGSGETARMRRLAWTFAARIGDKYQIRLAWPTLLMLKWKFLFGMQEIISACAWQNKQNDVCPVKNQISLCICPVWSVFAVHSVGSQGPKVSLCGQRRLWSDWADA